MEITAFALSNQDSLEDAFMTFSGIIPLTGLTRLALIHPRGTAQNKVSARL